MNKNPHAPPLRGSLPPEGADPAWGSPAPDRTGHPLMPRLAMAGTRPYPPAQSAFTQRFWQGLEEGHFLATHCPHCDRLAFPPKPFCPHCWQRGVTWRSIAPRGVLYAATTIYAAPKVFGAEAPYQVGIVDLQVGLRIATRVLGNTPTAQALDREMELVVLAYEDGPLFAARLPDFP